MQTKTMMDVAFSCPSSVLSSCASMDLSVAQTTCYYSIPISTLPSSMSSVSIFRQSWTYSLRWVKIAINPPDILAVCLRVFSSRETGRNKPTCCSLQIIWPTPITNYKKAVEKVAHLFAQEFKYASPC